MEEADKLCDRVAIMDHGKILALDTPAALEAERRRGHDRHRQGGRRPRPAGRGVSHPARGRHPDPSARRRRRAPDPGRDHLVPRVVEAAEAAGFSLADLSVTEPTLETVFIDLTGKELRD